MDSPDESIEPTPSRTAGHRGQMVDYLPKRPSDYDPGILLIGCGGISRHHLEAYRDAGLRVVGLVDIRREAATAMAKRFYPDAAVYTDYREALRSDDFEVVDVTTHPEVRGEIIADCLKADRHVLSQKPFVLNLDEGQRLIELAASKSRRLAVNQNGRWAPHFSYMRSAIAAGLLGKTFAVRMTCDWDHTWVEGTPFEHVKDLILYDYAIHWFDIVRCFLKDSQAVRVYASTGRTPHQRIMPDLLGQVLIEFDNAQATLSFDAMVRHLPEERSYVAGTEGVVVSTGRGNQDQTVTLETDEGLHRPALMGKWFPDGFRGTMCELLASIKENRVCEIDAADNLHSLALCFAAIESARTAQPQTPGKVRTLPK
jgi:predicted dehydrogenase